MEETKEDAVSLRSADDCMRSSRWLLLEDGEEGSSYRHSPGGLPGNAGRESGTVDDDLHEVPPRQWRGALTYTIP